MVQEMLLKTTSATHAPERAERVNRDLIFFHSEGGGSVVIVDGAVEVRIHVWLAKEVSRHGPQSRC